MRMVQRPIASLLFDSRRVFINAALALAAFCAVFALGSARADAATLTVSGGCTLTAAADSVNAGSNQGGCVAVGAYGTDDTISLPAGTHAFTGAVDQINRPVIFEGAGSGQTILDLSAATAAPTFNNTTGSLQSITIRDMAIIDGDNSILSWLHIQNFSTTLQRLEFYSTSAPSAEASFVININGGLYSGQENLIEDVYLHDITLDSNLININPDGTMPMNDNIIRRVTVHDIELTNVQGAAVISVGGSNAGSVEALIENVTLQDVDFAQQGGFVTAAAIAIGSDDIESVVTLRNSTIRFTRPTTTPNPLGLVVPAAVAVDGNTAIAEITAQNNVLVTNGYTNVASCFESEVDLGGTLSATLLSLGGNVTDDNSCNSLFTEPSDQNELTGLGATLGALADNGGFTLTAALQEGSPAIDAGVTVAGLTTDQRGTTRPQGAAYDSGAFELAAADLGDDDDGDDDGDDDDDEGNENNEDDESAGSGNNQDQAGSGGRLANTGAGIAKIVLLASTIISVAVALTYRTRKNLLYTLFR